MTVKSLRKQLAAAIAMTLVASVALGSSTYAWFVSNSQVTAVGAQVTATTAYSLLISRSATDDYQTVKDLNTNSGLTPVSTIGTRLAADKADMKNYSDDDETGKAADKGDVRFVTSNAWKDNLVINYDEVGKNSQTAEDVKYYYTDTIYLKAGQTSNIYIDSTTTGLLWGTWDAETGEQKSGADRTFMTFDSFVAYTDTAATGDDVAAHADAKAAYLDTLDKAQALVSTLRVGMQVTDITDTEKTDGSVVAADDIATLRADVTKSKFYVYQFATTQLTNQVITTDQGGANGITKAIGPVNTETSTIVADGATPNLATDANNSISGFDSLVSNAVPAISAMAIAGSQNAIVSNVALATGNVSKAIANTQANHVQQVDIYIWMEGCDEDVAAANLDEFNQGVVPGIQFGFCLGADAE